MTYSGTNDLESSFTINLDSNLNSSYLTYPMASSVVTSNGTYPVNINSAGITMDDTADIMIGDRSLKRSLEKLEERLNILSVNHKLETEWEELRALGDQYRKLESELTEKMKIWNILKKE